jgi:hypothetical protein
MALAPPVLKSAGIDYRQVLNGRRLREAITADGASKLRLIQNPSSPLSWAILPADISPEGDLTKLFSSSIDRIEGAPAEHVSAVTHAPAHFIRYKRGVWMAFAHPFPFGKRRFVSSQDYLGYVDVSPDQMPPSQGIEITEADIPQPDLLVPPDRDAVIIKAINTWAARNAIPIATLVRQPNEMRAVSPLSSTASRGLKLDLSELSNEELKRISIPLDIIVKIQFER